MEQKDLAKALGKSESEISKWMTGTRNFTFKTAAKIEAVLDESILQLTQEKKVEEIVRMYILNPVYQMNPSTRSSNIAKQMSTIISGNKAQSGNYLN